MGLNIKNISLFKTLIYNIRYVESKANKLRRITGCIIYRKSVLEMHRNSKIIINRGRLFINNSIGNKNPYTTQITLRKNSRIIVNGNFSIIRGCIVGLGENATLVVGNNSYINTHSTIFCNSLIEIGDEVMIADNVTIMDSDMHTIVGKENEITKSIRIGNHVWIGNGAKILKGVTIGEGSIVAAGAIVTRDVPPNSLVAGIPAKVIKRNVEWK